MTDPILAELKGQREETLLDILLVKFRFDVELATARAALAKIDHEIAVIELQNGGIPHEASHIHDGGDTVDRVDAQPEAAEQPAGEQTGDEATDTLAGDGDEATGCAVPPVLPTWNLKVGP